MLFNLFAREKEDPFELRLTDVLRFPDEHLLDTRRGQCGAIADHRKIDRHLSPSQQSHPFAGDDILHQRFAESIRILVSPGHEHHPDTQLLFKIDVRPEFWIIEQQEADRKLDQDPGAISGLRIRCNRPSVCQVAHRLDPFPDDVMALLPGNMGDEAHAARIVLEARVV